MAIRKYAVLLLACGFAAMIANNSALAWGAAGGGSGGGKRTAQTPIDPEKLRKIRDLTKRLKAELKFDNQKSKEVQYKEAGQAVDLEDLLKGLPASDPDVKAGQAILNQTGSTIGATPGKY
jgi:hypothetical protein